MIFLFRAQFLSFLQKLLTSKMAWELMLFANQTFHIFHIVCIYLYCKIFLGTKIMIAVVVKIEYFNL